MPARFTRTPQATRMIGVLVTLVGLGALGVSIAAVITLGPADIWLVNVRDIVTNHLGLTDIPVKTHKDAIVWEDRLPRAIIAAASGLVLGLCGLVLQSTLRNPLADPYILGVSSGASTGAVLVGMLGLGGSVLGLSTGAFIGALVAFAGVLLIVKLAPGGTSTFVLAGVASTQFFSALTSVAIFAFADSDEARGVMFWLLGSLEGVRWNQVALLGATSIACLIMCLICARALDLLTLGEDMAESLGLNTQFTRGALLVGTALVTAAVVSIIGAVGFVGLVIPHIARLLFGQAHRVLVPVTAIMGALFMVWVDALSRLLFSPSSLPVGVATALVGVPFFVWILVRNRGRQPV